MGDRFGLLFLEARDYAAGREDLLPRVMTDASGLRRLLPMEEQPEAVRNAFLLGGSGEMARYDAQLDETLRALFQSIGQSAHLKKHYFDYYNSLFLLHKLFLQVCADPAAPLSDGAWKDLALYLGDRTRLSGLVAQRLSFGARRAFAGPAQERPVSLRKEGMG